MVKKIIFQVLFALLLAPSFSAYGTAIFHVRENGSSSWPCGDITNPCNSISPILQNAWGIDEIKLARGTYTDSIVIDGGDFSAVSINGGWNQDFSTQQCDPANTSVNAKTSNAPVVSTNVGVGQDLTVTLACMSFRGTEITHRRGIKVSNNHGVATLKLKQVTLSNFAGQAIHLYTSVGIINVEIEKTTVRNNYQPAADRWFGAGIFAQSYDGGDTTIRVENSLFHNNEAFNAGAIYLRAADTGSTTDLTLLNSTVSNNSTQTSTLSPGGLLANSASSGTTSASLINSIIHGNTNVSGNSDTVISASTGGSSNVSAEHSIPGTITPWSDGVVGSNSTYTDYGNNLNVDPLLDSNLHLRDGSAAIDAARCGFSSLLGYLRVAPYDDIDGDKRPGYGELSDCDIGADEYQDPMCMPIQSKSGKIAVICL